MLYLLLTIITSVLIIISFKIFHNLGINTLQVITFNYFFGFLFGLIFSENKFDLQSFTTSQWFWPAILIGFVFIAGFVLFSKSTEKAGVSITAVSSKMSVIIPVMTGFFLFGDNVSITKVVGIVLAIASFYLVFKTDKGEKVDVKYILLPLLLFLTSGLNDSLVKYVEHHFLDGETLMFLTVVFFSAFLIGVVYLSTSKDRNNKKILYPAVIGGFVLGSINFWNAWVFVKSMEIFESSVLFPIINVSVVSIAAFSGTIFFKEKLKAINWAGIIMAVLAILLISMANEN